jgi:hypothetical protein
MADVTANSGAVGAGANPGVAKHRHKAALSSGAMIVLLIGVLIPCQAPKAAWAWIGVMAALIVFSGIVGVAINHRADGLIIDNRNRVSLSKFQAWAWSMVVLSSFMTGAIFRLRLGVPDPVGVTFPPELLACMGIAVTSLVATPALLSIKSNQDPADGQLAQTTAQLGANAATTNPVGKVFARTDPKHARWLDMFRGDEVGNAASPDLSKVQQFLITAVVLLVYGGGIWNALSAAQTKTFFSTLPVLSQTMVWLIGISHAGYLAYKAAPHTQSAPTN